MTPGVRGRLISAAFIDEELARLSGIREAPATVAREIRLWNDGREARLGPASSVRAIADVAAVPLLDLLGYRVSARTDAVGQCLLQAEAERTPVPVVVMPWATPLDAVWRQAVRAGIAADARWCLCSNGRTLRLVDTRRTWSRLHLELDLAAVGRLPETLTVAWSLLRAAAVSGADSLLERAVRLSARHGARVCRGLATGVLEALALVVRSLGAASRHTAPPILLDASMTVLYRVLFLMFAEARGLVPVWNPLYRDRYTIDHLVDALLAGRHRGTWQALVAIGRLAHDGCRAGDLRVTPFNGRLFSPLHAAAPDRLQVADEVIGKALLAVGTTPGPGPRRRRIRYADLDVEQLGAVYEQLLDYEASRAGGRVELLRSGDARKASGSFYTPRSLAGYLVRRTLAPLVRGRSAASILDLRVVDPAMGSGAFLVAACRYLAAAMEAALIRDGEWEAEEATPEARAALRREVAQRCLFGVDLNPMAVQLARLSLWLTTLSGERPLTFLDHRLAAGDSLAGASIADVLMRPPGCASRGRAGRALPLFDAAALDAFLGEAVGARLRLARETDDDVQTVRRKEEVLTALTREGTGLRRWQQVLDLWCACWFWGDERPPTPAVFHALSDAILRDGRTLPDATAREWRSRAANAAARHRFLHWELEFPEAFFDARGARAGDAGFDAVLGNPPWDMVRADSGGAAARVDRRLEARQLVGFVRGAGIYRADGKAHVNRYQLFVERALQLLRPRGRLGLVLPSGVVADAGSAPLRRRLFAAADVDSVVGMDNRAGIFPIHRSVRFVLLTATGGRATERTACRFGVSDPARLDAIDEAGGDEAFPVTLSQALLARLSGDDDLAMPEIASAADLRIVEGIAARHEWLSSPFGWQARFGRELNASDDRASFVAAAGEDGLRPIVEGKQLTPFRVALERSTLALSPAAAFTVRVPRKARLAYRDVASATNRLTLIAAIVPARAVTTHTLFVLRTPLSLERQWVLCALLNSFVANYLVRLRVNTHVTAAIMSRLPVPVLAEGDPRAQRLATLARTIAAAAGGIETMPEYAELQAEAAAAYGVSAADLEHVLGTFPLIPASVREETLARFVGARR